MLAFIRKDLLLVLLAYYCIFRSVEMKAFLGSTAAEILEISHTHTQNKQKLNCGGHRRISDIARINME